MEKTLSTKRKVVLKNVSLDDMNDCDDNLRMGMDKDGYYQQGLNRTQTAWIRKGLSGGDFKVAINGVVPDSVIKELSVTDKTELVELIREYITMGE